MVYGQVRSLRTRDFVVAARCDRRPATARIVLRHILPQLVPTIIVWGTLGIATNVMLEAEPQLPGHRRAAAHTPAGAA